MRSFSVLLFLFALRSGGERGASVETLRGTHGADFEATGTVKRGNERPCCGCFDKSVRAT